MDADTNNVTVLMYAVTSSCPTNILIMFIQYNDHNSQETYQRQKYDAVCNLYNNYQVEESSIYCTSP